MKKTEIIHNKESEAFVFIYKKGSKYLVRGLKAANDQHHFLISEGFKHVSTLSASIFLERILNVGDKAKIRILKEIVEPYKQD